MKQNKVNWFSGIIAIGLLFEVFFRAIITTIILALATEILGHSLYRDIIMSLAGVMFIVMPVLKEFYHETYWSSVQKIERRKTKWKNKQILKTQKWAQKN